MFELPIPEDIYDYDSFNLKDILDQIIHTLPEVEAINDKPKEVLSWIKKAKKISDMISLEIEERKAVEEFEDFCQQGEDYLKKLDAYNPYTKEQADNIPKNNEPKKQKLPSPIKLEQSQISTASNSSMSKANIETSDASRYKNEEAETEDGRKSTVTISEEQASKIYGTMHHAKKKKTTNKKNAMFDFIRQTLEATRITENTMSIGKSSISDSMNKKHHAVEETKEMSRKDRPSLSEATSGRSHHPGHFGAKPQKPPVNNRPIPRPDPNFNPSETRVGSMLSLGSTLPKFNVDVKKEKTKNSKKKKTPSMKDSDTESADENKGSATIAKSKTVDVPNAPTVNERKKKEKASTSISVQPSKNIEKEVARAQSSSKVPSTKKDNQQKSQNEKLVVSKPEKTLVKKIDQAVQPKDKELKSSTISNKENTKKSSIQTIQKSVGFSSRLDNLSSSEGPINEIPNEEEEKSINIAGNVIDKEEKGELWSK